LGYCGTIILSVNANAPKVLVTPRRALTTSKRKLQMATPDSTTYAVYRIVCFATGMCYVGLSKQPKERKCQHFRMLDAGNHDNSYLQRAYNKYGKSRFFFEVIETAIKKENITSREKYWINHFDSYQNGYNLTTGGENCNHSQKPCNWDGVTYPSISAAASAFGVTLATMSGHLKKGYTSSSDVKAYNHPKCITWNGINYPNITTAARANGISPGAMKYRIKMNYFTESDVKPQSNKCVWNGIEYVSCAAAARANGISDQAMKERLSRGRTSDDELKR